MKPIWERIWAEAVHAARQAPRMYFAPFVAAVREVVRVSREIEQENRQRRQRLPRGEAKPLR